MYARQEKVLYSLVLRGQAAFFFFLVGEEEKIQPGHAILCTHDQLIHQAVGVDIGAFV